MTSNCVTKGRTGYAASRCQRVVSNKGAPGADGMMVDQLAGFVKQYWPILKTRLLAGEYHPQGGPLSPLLSNILLNELDRELERRGHRFVRYIQVIQSMTMLPSACWR